MPTAFVTGGSGFVGGALIERLRAEGWDVRALARSERAAERVRELGAEPVMGDLDDRDAARRRGGAARWPSTRPRRWRTGATRRTSSGSTCAARENVVAACRDGGRAAARARGHRGGADGRTAAGQCRRGARRCGRTRRRSTRRRRRRPSSSCAMQRRRPRDGRGQAALRLGARRHDAAPGDGRDGRARAASAGSAAAAS